MDSSDITKRSTRVIERVMQLHKPNYVESMIINFDHEMSGGDDYFAEITLGASTQKNRKRIYW